MAHSCMHTCVCMHACVCVCEISKYVVTRSMFENVLCSITMQCVHVLCERGYGLKTNKLSCSCACSVVTKVKMKRARKESTDASSSHGLEGQEL